MAELSFQGLRGEPLLYLDHPYNTTALNERAIEVPLALMFIHQHQPKQVGPEGEPPGLEVGNVLGHYTTPSWLVVDLHEQAPGVENLDVMDIRGMFDWIVSISTLEHVGEAEASPTGPLAAITHLRSLLSSEGRLLLTVPSGWNAYLDSQLPRLASQAEASAFYSRWPGNLWYKTELQPLPYGDNTALGLFVAELGP